MYSNGNKLNNINNIFLITPISTPSSALLLRTAPTIWDVIIAITGGLAGGIGVTRKEKEISYLELQ